MFRYDLGHGVVLAPLEPWHAERLVAAIDADRDHLQQLTFSHVVRSEEDAKRFLDRFAHAHVTDEAHLAGLWAGPRLVGLVMLSDFNLAMRRCEIGVWISADLEGRGLVRAAASRALAWAIEERGMRRVQWSTMLDNTRSQALAERIGFTREGVARQSFIPVPGGPSVDAEVWSITAEEWLASRQGGTSP